MRDLVTSFFTIIGLLTVSAGLALISPAAGLIGLGVSLVLISELEGRKGPNR